MISVLMPVKDGLDTFLLSLQSILSHTPWIRSIYILDSSDTPLISQSSLVGELFSLLDYAKVTVQYSVKKLSLINARVSLLRTQMDLGSPHDSLMFLDSDILLSPHCRFSQVMPYLQGVPHSFVAAHVHSPTNIAGYPNFVQSPKDISNTWMAQFAKPADKHHEMVNTAGLFCTMFNRFQVTEDLLYHLERVSVREDMFFTRYLSLHGPKPGALLYSDLRVYHVGKTRKQEWDIKAFERDFKMFESAVDAHGLETLSTIL